MQPVELGLDVGGHVDVVDNDTLEAATEGDVAPIAVHDLQAGDVAIANLEAGEVAQVDAGTTELVTLGVLSRHRDSLPYPAPARRPAHRPRQLNPATGPSGPRAPPAAGFARPQSPQRPGDQPTAAAPSESVSRDRLRAERFRRAVRRADGWRPRWFRAARVQR